ncbi:MAG: hypothetical protein SFZ03_07425 [Candidatus Melainabacteria bacterium]|nr:hypothetical protein [Candidatus Melainabacteria bacterium]
MASTTLAPTQSCATPIEIAQTKLYTQLRFAAQGTNATPVTTLTFNTRCYWNLADIDDAWLAKASKPVDTFKSEQAQQQVLKTIVRSQADFVALQEIGCEKTGLALPERLQQTAQESGCPAVAYKALVPSDEQLWASDRTLRNVLLYNQNRFRLLESGTVGQFCKPSPQQTCPNGSSLFANPLVWGLFADKSAQQQRPWLILSVHLKARHANRGPDTTEYRIRADQSRAISDFLTQWLAEHFPATNGPPPLDIVILGDFNQSRDNPYFQPLVEAMTPRYNQRAMHPWYEIGLVKEPDASNPFCNHRPSVDGMVTNIPLRRVAVFKGAGELTKPTGSDHMAVCATFLPENSINPATDTAPNTFEPDLTAESQPEQVSDPLALAEMKALLPDPTKAHSTPPGKHRPAKRAYPVAEAFRKALNGTEPGTTQTNETALDETA